MIEIKAYNCDYCKKYSKSKGAMTKHERVCYHNPATRSCATCKNMYQEGHMVDEILQISRDLPCCTKGIELTDYFHVTLKNHCPLWEQEKEEDE